MSAILGLFGPAAAGGSDQVPRLMATMARRGTDSTDTWHVAGGTLAVARHAWEVAPGFAGPAAVVAEDDLVVAADASLYYRDDLLRALPPGHRPPPTDSPGHLILAAWRAWGEAALARLEGDFAFILYDRADRRVFCARDFAGRRPLYYAELGDSLVVASGIGGVLAHPLVPDDLDLAAVAETAGALFAASNETVWRAVRGLGAGRSLTWQGRGRGATFRCATTTWWEPPHVDSSRATAFEEGAEELRSLLVAAVAERLDPQAPTSIWLSGGWDSPAVFAAGEAAFEEGLTGHAPRPVSISYPPGDPGREDELIASVMERYGRATHWIDIATIPLLVEPAEAAARREEPFAHVFEHWIRALARGSRRVGARVGLDGNGGDVLFAASLLYLPDLLRRGRLREFRREWAAKGLPTRNWRRLFDLALQPLFPAWARGLGQRLLPGINWSGPFDPVIPEWIDAGFARRNGLRERARQHAPPPRGASLSEAEFRYYLTHPTGPRLGLAANEIVLEEGVEARSPLYDHRVVRFAASRPVTERTRGNETKRLLRRACQGWLPPAFLAPRRRRTGGTRRYAGTALRQTHAAFITGVLEETVLEEMGVVSGEALRRHWQAFLAGDGRYELPLYLTFQTELWLRSRGFPPPGRQRPHWHGVSVATVPAASPRSRRSHTGRTLPQQEASCTRSRSSSVWGRSGSSPAERSG